MQLYYSKRVVVKYTFILGRFNIRYFDYVIFYKLINLESHVNVWNHVEKCFCCF